jgi:hypothetical protein
MYKIARNGDSGRRTDYLPLIVKVADIPIAIIAFDIHQLAIVPYIGTVVLFLCIGDGAFKNLPVLDILLRSAGRQRIAGGTKIRELCWIQFGSMVHAIDVKRLKYYPAILPAGTCVGSASGLRRCRNRQRNKQTNDRNSDHYFH